MLHSKFQISNFWRQHDAGFTLIEIVVSVGIIAILAVIVGQVYLLIVSQTTYYRQQSVVTALADQYMEIARNLPYSQVGTLNGNPHGSLADSVSPIATTVNGAGYQIYYVVTYVHDPADPGSGSIPDYKQVKLYIKNTTTGNLVDFLTAIAPQNLEGSTPGGALSIEVFNAVGQPVPGATINIQNNLVTPTINLTRTSDANGDWVEVGLPDSTNGYHITVTKTGYSGDQTYPISAQNPNPVKPDATISNGQVTQISFSIDLVSNLTFDVSNQVCSPLSGVSLNVSGSQLIGTPNVLKFDNNYTSDANGQVVLNNIGWDTYIPTLTGSSYMIYGTSPTQEATILPGTNETFGVVLGPSTTNSLLVIVKDASTGNPVEGSNIELKSASQSVDINEITGGSNWEQQSWSGGPGQVDFFDPSKYYSDDGNINSNQIPAGLRLAEFDNAYVNSGTLTSSSFDTGSATTAYTTITWQPTSQNPSTNIQFQIATNNDDATWNYVGPDGTANSYYTVPGTNISSASSNNRYLRYKVFLSTSDPTQTPVLTSVNINYVAACFTPGQSMFAGLGAGSDYQVIVTDSAYQTQTINNVNIGGYNVLEVSLNQ